MSLRSMLPATVLLTVLGILATFSATASTVSPAAPRRADAPRRAAARRPHMLFVLADDLGYADVSLPGRAPSDIQTPVLHALAARGVELTQFYGMHLCTPSRSALLSGRLPIRTGMQSWVIRAPQAYSHPLDDVFFPQLLQEAGYRTAIVGKWHLGMASTEMLPTRRGFHSAYGLLNAEADHLSHVSNWDPYIGLDLHDNDKPDWGQEGVISSRLFADRAIDLVRDHDPASPLFLYLALQAPHTPLQASPEFLNMYPDLPPGRREYAAMVTEMDHHIGRVLTAFDDAGLLNDTVVVFQSDNGGDVSFGGASNEPLRGEKFGLFEGGVRVPAVVAGPGIAPGRRITDQLFHITDWFPTLCGLAGVDPAARASLDGVDIWDAIAHDAPSPRDEVLINIERTDRSRQSAIRVGDWKLMTGALEGWYPGDPPPDEEDVLLFNVALDPSESTDLAADYPEVVARLADRLAAYGATAVPPLHDQFPDDPRCDPALFGGVWMPWL